MFSDRLIGAEALKRLSLRGIVALVARALARRFQGFDLPPSADRDLHMAAVGAAIQVLGDYAAARPLPENLDAIADAANRANDARPPDSLTTLPNRASLAVDLVRMALRGDTGLLPVRAVMFLGGVGPEAEANRADYERLLTMGLGTFPEEGAPVDVSDYGPLGPLWPAGAGNGTPAAVADSTIPTEAEIAKLPRWAQVAFAARCARRVLPLFSHHWPHAPRAYSEAVTDAVTLAEHSAAEADAALGVAASNAADAAAGFATADAATDTREAAVAAARSAAYVGSRSFTVLHAASRAATALARATKWSAGNPLRADFDLLLRLSAAEGWTDDTPVPPGVFGPLWPDGPPPGWPIDEGKPGSEPGVNDPVSPPAFVVVWDPAVVAPAQYARVVAAISNLARAHGAEGIKRLQSKPFAAPAPVEVPTP